MAHMRLSRAGRKYIILAELRQSDYDVHTVNSIARLVGLQPSTYLRELLQELIDDEKLLYETWYDDDGNVTKRFYALPSYMPRQSAYYVGNDDTPQYERG